MNSSISVVPLLLLALGACQGVRTAPKSLPRVEIELVCNLSPAFRAQFAEGVDQAALQETVESTIEPMADVGLRFYPVLSTKYAEGQDRPDYVMTVDVKNLNPERSLVVTQANDVEQGRTEDPVGTTRATLHTIRCEVTVRIDRRQPSGPQLLVGISDGAGSRKVTRNRPDVGTVFTLEKVGEEINETTIDAGRLRKVVASATERAFAGLQQAIDRELTMLAPDRE